jgi:purine-nucleoside/S-methyl-5'-thioadenosine phosphorylase / adenosine deaminase
VAIERRDLGGQLRALVSTTLERAGFLAAFTERTGGVSPAPFGSLNLSLVTDDDPANGRENRARVVRRLDIPTFATPYQVHGAKVARVGAKRAGAGFEDPDTRIRGADVLLTRSRGVPLAVMTADCLPIVLASPEENEVAVVHAGWRGLARGILAAAVGAFEGAGGIRAVMGPAIGPCHYEVGEDVALAVASGSETGAVTRRRGGSLYLDLPGTARATLKARGVGRIEDVGLCTACERKRFYSHRRDGGTGRQAAIAMRL